MSVPRGDQGRALSEPRNGPKSGTKPGIGAIAWLLILAGLIALTWWTRPASGQERGGCLIPGVSGLPVGISLPPSAGQLSTRAQRGDGTIHRLGVSKASGNRWCRDLSRERLIPTQCAQGNCVRRPRLLCATERSGQAIARAGRCCRRARLGGSQDCRGCARRGRLWPRPE